MIQAPLFTDVLKEPKIKEDEQSKRRSLAIMSSRVECGNHACVRLLRCSLMFDRRGVAADASSIFKGKVIQAFDVLCSVF